MGLIAAGKGTKEVFNVLLLRLKLCLKSTHRRSLKRLLDSKAQRDIGGSSKARHFALHEP